MTRAAAIVAAAYLIGGIPFGFLLFRATGGGDIRAHGSGNIGATNIARSAGWRLGLATLALDAGKGAVGVLAGMRWIGDPAWAAAAGFAAVAGHCYPIWLKFRGGKGVATGAGAFAILHPAALGVALLVFLVAAGVSRIVAVGSVLAALAFPAASAILGGAPAPVLWAAAAVILIVVRHKENIGRILRGQENRFRLGGKVETK